MAGVNSPPQSLTVCVISIEQRRDCRHVHERTAPIASFTAVNNGTFNKVDARYAENR